MAEPPLSRAVFPCGAVVAVARTLGEPLSVIAPPPDDEAETE